MNIYDFSVDKINGEFTSLREYEGKGDLDRKQCNQMRIYPTV